MELNIKQIQNNLFKIDNYLTDLIDDIRSNNMSRSSAETLLMIGGNWLYNDASRLYELLYEIANIEKPSETWIPLKEKDKWRCSNCDTVVSTSLVKDGNYCPGCGCKIEVMRCLKGASSPWKNLD